jgi:hypothetical protein
MVEFWNTLHPPSTHTLWPVPYACLYKVCFYESVREKFSNINKNGENISKKSWKNPPKKIPENLAKNPRFPRKIAGIFSLIPRIFIRFFQSNLPSVPQHRVWNLLPRQSGNISPQKNSAQKGLFFNPAEPWDFSETLISYFFWEKRQNSRYSDSVKCYIFNK